MLIIIHIHDYEKENHRYWDVHSIDNVFHCLTLYILQEDGSVHLFLEISHFL